LVDLFPGILLIRSEALRVVRREAERRYRAAGSSRQQQGRLA
jgi:hypothetical protein